MPSEDYHSEFIGRIRDSDKWPDFDQPCFLSELNELADGACEKKTIEGYLASVLIYHQLAEEMLHLLLRCSEFFIQLSVFPSEIRFPLGKRPMFGRVLEALNRTIEFENKKRILSLARSLNDKRVAIVHGLTRETSLEDIKTRAASIKTDFDFLYKAFEDAYDWFRLVFHDFRKDIDRDEWQDDCREE